MNSKIRVPMTCRTAIYEDFIQSEADEIVALANEKGLVKLLVLFTLVEIVKRMQG